MGFDRRRRAVLLLGAWAGLFAAPPARGQAVSRVVYENPVAGVRIEIPSDWEMATRPWGTCEFAIDASTGNPGLVHPLIVFFRSSEPPAETAKRLADGLKAIGGGAVPKVRATGNGDEQEVTMASGAGAARGALAERWLCRKEGRVSYAVGAMIRPEFAAAARADIDKALASCRPIRQVPVFAFREPTENAYTLTLPHGWKAEGRIVRGENLPGAFDWKAASPDGTSGCFVSPPGPLLAGYVPAGRIAEGPALAALRGVVPDLRLDRVEGLGRVSAYARDAMKLAGPTLNPMADRVNADYLGSINGTAIRLRVGVLTYTPHLDPRFPGGGGVYCAWGYWAPADRFDALLAIPRGVLASLSESPKWTEEQRKAVFHVLTGRLDAATKANEKWDAYLGGHKKIVNDPDGGRPQVVPDGDGTIARDPDGKMVRLPEGEKVPEGWKEIPEK